MKKNNTPLFDKDGLHILDPNDKLGIKSQYITILQQKSMARYLPEGNAQMNALDLGCGFGRLTSFIATKHWNVIGVDPDPELIQHAQERSPSIKFMVGGLPDLPFPHGTIHLVVLQNVLRSLHLMKRLDLIKGLGRFLTRDGMLFLVENIRYNNSKYIQEEHLINLLKIEGFKLEQRIPIRSGRWWMIYLIQFGFIPRQCLDKIAEYELNKMAKNQKQPKWQYYNIVFIFKKIN